MKRASAILRVALVAIPLVYFIGCGLRWAAGPGLDPDEAMFVDASVSQHPRYIALSIGRFPVMIMRYLGALKAYLFRPVFAVFGVTTASIRVPALLLGAVSLVVLAGALRRVLPGRAVVLLLFLLATDPTFVLLTTVDFGPTALMSLARAALIAALLSLCSGISPAKVGLVALVCALGAWDKLNFLWIIFAIGGSLVLLHGRRVLELARASGWRERTIAGVVALFLTAALVRAVTAARDLTIWHAGQEQGWLGRMQGAAGYVATVVNGQTAAEFLLHRSSRLPSAGWILLLLAGVAVVASWRCRRHPDAALRRVASWNLMVAATAVAILLQMSLTRRAGGIHHAILVTPAAPLLAVGAFALIDAAGWRRTALVTGTALAIVVAVQVVLCESQLAAARRGIFRPEFSREIEDLAAFVEREAGSHDAIILPEWGIGPQLLALTPPAVSAKILDIWPQFLALSPDARRLAAPADHLDGKRVLFVFSEAGLRLEPAQRANCFRFLKVASKSFRWGPTIRNRDGLVLYPTAEALF